MEDKLFEGLTEEQIAKIKACHSAEEIMELAAEEDIELTEEQLAAVSGGACSNDDDKDDKKDDKDDKNTKSPIVNPF